MALDRTQLRPVDYPGLVRLGLPRDGGYVVPATEVRTATVLLSLGINQDWSFDRAFVEANPRARVIGVDHSVGAALFARQIAENLINIPRDRLRNRRHVRKDIAVLRNSLDYFLFFRGRHRHIRKRVARHDSASTISVASLCDMARASGRTVFLKMDVEGAEYDLIADIVGCEASVHCLVAEFHAISKRTDAFNRSVAQLLEHFRIVHIHGNNYSSYDAANDFPNAVEITFVHRAIFEGPPVLSARDYPRAGLDLPNLPRRPDYPLHFE